MQKTIKIACDGSIGIYLKKKKKKKFWNSYFKAPARYSPSKGQPEACWIDVAGRMRKIIGKGSPARQNVMHDPFRFSGRSAGPVFLRPARAPSIN